MQVRNFNRHVRRFVVCCGTRILAALLLYGAMAIAASAQTYVILHSFSGPDGEFPTGPLVQGVDGKWYGTTEYGGANFGTKCQSNGGSGCGSIFKIGRYGALTTFYTFCPQTGCPDGYAPMGSLAEGPYGSYYGIAMRGGFGSRSGGGTAFRFTPGAPEVTLYTFCTLANCTDGFQPSSVVEGWDGSLHGTTQFGGFGVGITSAGDGTVYRLTPGGKLTTTYTFCRHLTCPDGSQPQDLIQGTDGNLYGVTLAGGIINNAVPPASSGAGTLFRIGSTGFTTLSLFCTQTACSDGASPLHLIQAADGDLYGVTEYGGHTDSNNTFGNGTVFKVTTAGTLTTLYTFCTQTGCPDGGDPVMLMQGSDLNFYGTTAGGGSNHAGTIFRLTPGGTLTTLHNFASYEGAPTSLMQGTDGAFYGTIYSGGGKGRGSIFRLDMGLGPFVQPVLTFGKVGARVTILGTDLTGATAVHFNGTASTFTVGSGTAISTTVPAGATSGPVTVTTPSGTLTSKVAFTVLP